MAVIPLTVKTIWDGAAADRGLDGLESRAGNTAKALSAGFTKVGGALTLGLTLPILAVGGAVSQLGMDVEESRSLVENSFLEMTDDIRTWSETTSASIISTGDDVEAAAATFFNMTTGMGVARDEAFELSTGFVELGADIASFYDLSPEEAMIKLSSAIAGSSEPMRALGVDVRVAAVEAYALANGMIAEGEAMDEATRIAATYGTIIAQTSAATGDLERTQDSATNQIRAFKADMKELGQELGTILVPLIKEIVTNVREWFSAFQELTPEQQKLGLVIAGVAAAIGPLLLILGQLISIAPLVGTAVTVMFGPWGIAIAAVIAGVALIIANWDVISEAAVELGATIVVALKPVIEWFVTNLPLMLETWETVMSALRAIWDTIGPPLLAGWETTWTVIKTTAILLWEGIKLAFEVLFTALGGLLRAGMQIINGDWSGAWDTIKETASAIWDTIKEAFSGMLDTLLSGLTTWKDNIVAQWQALGDMLVWGSIIPDMAEAIKVVWKEMLDTMLGDTKATMAGIATEFNDLNISIPRPGGKEPKRLLPEDRESAADRREEREEEQARLIQLDGIWTDFLGGMSKIFEKFAKDIGDISGLFGDAGPFANQLLGLGGKAFGASMFGKGGFATGGAFAETGALAGMGPDLVSSLAIGAGGFALNRLFGGDKPIEIGNIVDIRIVDIETRFLNFFNFKGAEGVTYRSDFREVFESGLY